MSYATLENSTCDMTSVFMRSFSNYHADACSAAARLGSSLGEDALNSGAKEILDEVHKDKVGAVGDH